MHTKDLPSCELLRLVAGPRPHQVSSAGLLLALSHLARAAAMAGDSATLSQLAGIADDLRRGVDLRRLHAGAARLSRCISIATLMRVMRRAGELGDTLPLRHLFANGEDQLILAEVADWLACAVRMLEGPHLDQLCTVRDLLIVRYRSMEDARTGRFGMFPMPPSGRR